MRFLFVSCGPLRELDCFEVGNRLNSACQFDLVMRGEKAFQKVGRQKHKQGVILIYRQA